MPHDMRITIASAVALALKAWLHNATIEQSQTTSGCPLIKLTLWSGHSYNLTITNARKS